MDRERLDPDQIPIPRAPIHPLHTAHERRVAQIRDESPNAPPLNTGGIGLQCHSPGLQYDAHG